MKKPRGQKSEIFEVRNGRPWTTKRQFLGLPRVNNGDVHWASIPLPDLSHECFTFRTVKKTHTFDFLLERQPISKHQTTEDSKFDLINLRWIRGSLLCFQHVASYKVPFLGIDIHIPTPFGTFESMISPFPFRWDMTTRSLECIGQGLMTPTQTMHYQGETPPVAGCLVTFSRGNHL